MILKNSIVELLNQLITILSGIIIPRYIILTYGSEINGLSSSIIQLLNILNFMQAGAVSAAALLMYGPMQAKEFEKIRSYFITTKKHFLRLACLFFCASLIAGPLFAYSLSTDIPFNIVTISVYLVAIKMAIDLIYTYPFRALYNSNERNYIMSLGHLIEVVCSNLISLLIILSESPFFYIFLGLNIGCFLKVLYLHNKAKKFYPYVYMNSKNRIDSSILPNSVQSLLNELSISLVIMSPTVLISVVYSLKDTSIYYTYNLVFVSLNTIIACIYGSYSSRMGLIYSSGDQDNIAISFDRMQFILYFIGFGLFSCAGILYKSFIMIYTTGSDILYYNKVLIYLMSIMGFANCLRIPSSVMISATGLFTKMYKTNIILSLSSLILSIVLTQFKFEYICLGPIFYYILLTLVQNYILIINNVIANNKKLGFSIVIGFIMTVVSSSIGNNIQLDNYKEFVFYGICILIIIYSLLCFLMKFKFKTESLYYYNSLRRCIHAYINF